MRCSLAAVLLAVCWVGAWPCAAGQRQRQRRWEQLVLQVTAALSSHVDTVHFLCGDKDAGNKERIGCSGNHSRDSRQGRYDPILTQGHRWRVPGGGCCAHCLWRTR